MAWLFTYDDFVHALAGSVANGTAMSVFYPLDTVRSRLQLEDEREAKNTIAVMKDIVKEEGLGLEPVIYSLLTSSFVYFYSFHGLRRIGGEKSALKDLTFGAIAGAINVLATTPLWVVNTRIKMQGSRMIGLAPSSNAENNDVGDQKHSITASHQNNLHQDRYLGLVDGLIKIANTEGLGALWSSTGPSLILVSNPAMQFMIFELLKRNLQETLLRKELSSFHVFTLGFVSKFVSTLISYPLQVVQSKKRYGAPHLKNKSMKRILSDIVQREGPAGLYKGMESKMIQTVLTTALMFVFYERIHNIVTRVGKSI